MCGDTGFWRLKQEQQRAIKKTYFLLAFFSLSLEAEIIFPRWIFLPFDMQCVVLDF